jgi:hypothetical protein
MLTYQRLSSQSQHKIPYIAYLSIGKPHNTLARRRRAPRPLKSLISTSYITYRSLGKPKDTTLVNYERREAYCRDANSAFQIEPRRLLGRHPTRGWKTDAKRSDAYRRDAHIYFQSKTEGDSRPHERILLNRRRTSLRQQNIPYTIA